MPIIGIDLGTTNSLCSIWKEGKCVFIPNAFGETLTPSVVSIDDNDAVLVGKIAKERLISHPARTASSFKQFMGTAKTFQLGTRTFSPEDLSSLVLRQLKSDAESFLEETVEEAVISVPAYFNNAQRMATKLAGELAGLRVDRIINEPSAAALCYQNAAGGDGTFLVFDYGGGTLDISVVDIFMNVVDIVAIAGDNHLGGDDIDHVIVDSFLQKHPKLIGKLSESEKASLLRVAEKCKIALTDLPLAMLSYTREGETFEMMLDNHILLDICAEQLGKVRALMSRVLKDCKKNIAQIDQIILVGGSGKMALVRKYLEHITGKVPLSGVDPDKAIGAGAGLVAAIKERNEDVKDTVLTDICPFSLGLAVHNPNGRELMFSPIIERNVYLPVSKKQTYHALHSGQTYVKLSIYQGESLLVGDNLFLGEFDIPIPKMSIGNKAAVDVRFTYDINGILEVDATCLQTGQSEDKLIVMNTSMSDFEVEKRRKQLQKLKIAPRDEEGNQLLIATAQRLYEEHWGSERELIGRMLQNFEHLINGNTHTTDVLRARKSFGHFLRQMEGFDDGLYVDSEEDVD